MRARLRALLAEVGAVVAALRHRGFVVFVIALVTVLYALGLVVPQRPVVGAAAWEAWRAQHPALVRALEVSGLADVYRAPGTYVALGFFFLSLLAVIADRLPRLLRRTRVDSGLPLELASIAGRKGTLAVSAREPEAALRRAEALLARSGYRLHVAGPAAVRAVRFRLAPLGFVLFHGAFAILLAGGVLLDLTRFSGIADVGDGERFDARTGEYAERTRDPRVGPPRPAIAFTVAGVRPRSEQGQPIALEVDVLLDGERSPRVANINEPVNVGTTSILSDSAGPMPLFTCRFEGAEDGAWVKLVPNATGRTRVLLEPCGLDVLARPAEAGEAPSSRGGQGAMVRTAGVARLEDVARTGIEVAVRGPDGAVASRVLRPGDALATPDGRRVLRMQDFRYYARLQVVDERGGGLLWAGFVLGTLGLVLRLALFRREIAIVADAAAGRVLVATAADVAGWRPDGLLARLAAELRGPERASDGAPPA